MGRPQTLSPKFWGLGSVRDIVTGREQRIVSEKTHTDQRACRQLLGLHMETTAVLSHHLSGRETARCSPGSAHRPWWRGAGCCTSPAWTSARNLHPVHAASKGCEAGAPHAHLPLSVGVLLPGCLPGWVSEFVVGEPGPHGGAETIDTVGMCSVCATFPV